MDTPESIEGSSPPQEFRVRLTHVATIPLYVLSYYLVLLNRVDIQLSLGLFKLTAAMM
jgi:hypothetical protein